MRRGTASIRTGAIAKLGIALLVLVSIVAASASLVLTNDALAKESSGSSRSAAGLANSLNGLQPFTIAALPDTQVYSEDGELGFAKQVEWVLENARKKNIVFVTHLGDVVDNGTDEAQWDNAMAALDPLLRQEWLPFSIVRGNHDDPTFFLDNLPVSLMESKPWFVAVSESGLCQAQTFRVQGISFLHVGFQKDPTDAELAWANDLLSQPSLRGMPVIVSTHDYIDGSGRSFTGRRMWDGFVKNNPMVFMVLNGHTHTEYALVSHNAANRPVYQMLSDYQDRDFGGNGLMRLITIDPVAGQITVKTFSPYYQTETDEEDQNGDPIIQVESNYFETDSDSQFAYSVNLRERFNPFTEYDFGPEPPPPPLPPLNDLPSDLTYTHVFQNRRPLVGTTVPYAGTVDVQINENNANLNYGGEATLTTDMDDNGSRVHAFLRFDDIIGNGPGQIPAGSQIVSAKLVLSCVSSTKGLVKMHRMLVPWSETSTWMDFTPVDGAGAPTWAPYTYYNTELKTDVTLPSVMVGGGVQADDTEAMSSNDAVFSCKKPIPIPFIIQPPVSYGIVECDLTAAVQAWANGQTNYGWFFEPTSGDGWDFETAEGKQPPALLVEVATP
jgi:predicted phosphodiesterase